MRRTQARAGLPSRLLLSLGALGAAGSIAGLGTFATFTDTEAPTTAIDSGDVEIALNGATDVTSAYTNLVPGDSGVRYVTVQNTGDVELANVVLTVGAAPSNLLTVDAGADTSGLEVQIQSCAVAWAAGACAAPTALYAMGNILSASNTTISTNMAVNANAYLKFTVQLPATAGNSYQNLATTVTWTFTGTQRAAVTNK